MRPLGTSTSVNVRDRIQLTTCRSSRVASPFSSMPILRCRRSTLRISQQRLTSSHAQLRTCPCRLFRCDRRPCVKFDVAFMHHIVSYRIAIFCVISIVSYRFPLRPYRANTILNPYWSHRKSDSALLSSLRASIFSKIFEACGIKLIV